MANKMLIDASHPEETRVVVVRGNRVQEFDFEAADKKPLRGNIYLAKVTRVEPSLQAAFVDYGGVALVVVSMSPQKKGLLQMTPYLKSLLRLMGALDQSLTLARKTQPRP
ncbi:MAG: hypothetical protein EB015_06535 [Methylocystaceae bacterium]|nr:hypothetical protein [Methylocystaceae bacterium]